MSENNSITETTAEDFSGLLGGIGEVLEQARKNVAVHVNNELVQAYWNIGRLIVEHEQDNALRAGYGKETLRRLSKALTREFGRGFSVSNIQFMRRFYQEYQIQQTLSGKLTWSHYCELLSISDKNKRSFYEKECDLGGISNNLFASRYTYVIPEKDALIAQVERVIGSFKDDDESGRNAG